MIDPQPTYEELVQRVVELEERRLSVRDLPMRSLQERLFRGPQIDPPDADTFLLPHSTGRDSLAEPLVSGVIETDGTIISGSGFTVVRNAIGDYTITFDPAFRAAPAVTATVERTEPRAPRIAAAATISTVQIQTFNTATGALSDERFHFIAIGEG